MDKLGIIVPYFHSDSRLPLLFESVKSLNPRGRARFCCVETGPRMHAVEVANGTGDFFYFKSDTFNRGKAVNLAAQLLVGDCDYLMIADGDLIYPHNYLDLVLQVVEPVCGWARINKWDLTQTLLYMGKRVLPEGWVKVTSNPYQAAGGVLVLPTSLFVELKGLPEEFPNWGGSDNVMWGKLMAFGHKFKTLDVELFHMYHAVTQDTNGRKELAQNMLNWDRMEWETHLYGICEWGEDVW